jgi:hypothetical protein
MVCDLLIWSLVGAVFVVTLSVAGIGLAALLSPLATAATWQVFSSIGDAFGVVALVTLVATFGVQYRELRQQRAELQAQRETLSLSQVAHDRTAEAAIREVHIQLMRMAIDDLELAQVWPDLPRAATPTKVRQYLYANLIMSEYSSVLKYRSDDDCRAILRILLSGPLIREYWRATRHERQRMAIPGTAWARFIALADEVFTESRDQWPVNPPKSTGTYDTA